MKPAPGDPHVEIPKTIIFRAVHEDDMPFLFTLYATTRADELSVVPWSPQEKEEFLKMQFRAQHAAYTENYPGASFEVILCDEQSAGRLYVHRKADEIRVMDIALLPKFQRQGIGWKIMRDIIQEAREADLPVRIHVEQNNPAKRLYERLGFAKIGETDVYFLMEWTQQ